MKRLMMAVAALAMVGCSGSVSGTVAGNSLNVADSIFAILKNDAGKQTGALVFLSDKPKLCESLKANRTAKSATGLLFAMSRSNNDGIIAPDVGEYTVISVGQTPTSAGNYSVGVFSRSDANCDNQISDDSSRAKSGLIKVTALKGETNGNAAGNFDVTFGCGDKVTGSFKATFCDISQVQANPNCE